MLKFNQPHSIIKGMIIILTLLLSPFTKANEALSTQAFSFKADISAGKQSLREFELPYEVLKNLQRQDYGDLRIFNHQNQSIPFSITVIKPTLLQQKSEHTLDFFTLPKNPRRQSRLRISINNDKTRIDFRSRLNNYSSQRSYIILENPYRNKKLHQLKLHWTVLDNAFSLKLKLETSDDLEHWTTIKSSSTLYDLKHNLAVLIKDTIQLSPPSQAHYFRLSFNNQPDFLHSINKITAAYHHQNQPVYNNWKTFFLTQGETASEWLFNTESVAPIAKMRFDIPQTGLFYQGSLFSKYHPIKPNKSHKNSLKRNIKKALRHRKSPENSTHNFWRYQQKFTQYRLLSATGEINSSEFLVQNVKAQTWRIVLQQPFSLLPEQIPKISIAWYPVKITFLAQGNEPYQLLFGQEKSKPQFTNLPKTLQNNQPERVKLSNIVRLKKETHSNISSQTMSSWAKELNWQKIILWLVLCFGVLLMAMMAYRLYQGMNK